MHVNTPAYQHWLDKGNIDAHIAGEHLTFKFEITALPTRTQQRVSDDVYVHGEPHQLKALLMAITGFCKEYSVNVEDIDEIMSSNVGASGAPFGHVRIQPNVIPEGWTPWGGER